MRENQNDKVILILLTGLMGFYFLSELRIFYSYYEPNCFPSSRYFWGRMVVFHIGLAITLSVLIEKKYVENKVLSNEKQIIVLNWCSMSFAIISCFVLGFYYKRNEKVVNCSRNYSILQKGASNPFYFILFHKKMFWISILLLATTSGLYFALMSLLLK